MASGYGMSEWSITLGEPRHVDVSGGHAYVAVPTEVRWLQDAEPAERACLMTMALREGADGWRISSLTWAWSQAGTSVHRTRAGVDRIGRCIAKGSTRSVGRLGLLPPPGGPPCLSRRLRAEASAS